MNTINGNFIEKTIPDTKNATLNVNIGGVDSTMTVEKFGAAVVQPLPSSILKLDADISNILQVVKDVTGNSSQLQISNNVIKIGKTLLIGDPGTASGTFTIQGNLAGQAFYDRLWNGASTTIIYTLFANDGGFFLSKQIGGSYPNVLSIAKDTGYGKFEKGTLYPSKTTTEINDPLITPPVESLTVWNSTLKTLCSYDGTVWNNATPYRKYVAIINQTAGNIPVATILENTFLGAPYFTRIEVSTGFWVYNLILDGAFVANKTFIQATAFYKDSSNTTRQFLIFRNSNDVCQISNTTGTDGVLLNISIEIRVYN
jgi:hypothetical protein